ncbi:unnamed protein product [Timema podura]|uniref:Ribosomal protein S18 n=1 Tax=Timema podura TaxID=61482 RepID=A0ABN7PQL4_TIMPD|nr:unnamed protein product [Timema podura]
MTRFHLSPLYRKKPKFRRNFQ